MRVLALATPAPRTQPHLQQWPDALTAQSHPTRAAPAKTATSAGASAPFGRSGHDPDRPGDHGWGQQEPPVGPRKWRRCTPRGCDPAQDRSSARCHPRRRHRARASTSDAHGDAGLPAGVREGAAAAAGGHRHARVDNIPRRTNAAHPNAGPTSTQPSKPAPPSTPTSSAPGRHSRGAGGPQASCDKP